MDLGIVTVSQCLGLINQLLATTIPRIKVEGEVSGWRISQNKWVFFDIQDEEASLKCFMSLFRLTHPIRDGMKVLIAANPQIHRKYGFSLVVDSIIPRGEGALQKSLELLKADLTRRGLFDIQRKRQIPPYPERIGVVTSSQAAAFHDVTTIIQKRWPQAGAVLFDCSVQGESAPRQLSAAITAASSYSPSLDVLLVVRGGGSLEDLAAFNSEPVVLAVAACRVPVVTGIGHQRDETLTDLAADLTATTPTNAAQLVTPDYRQEKREIAGDLDKLIGDINQRIEANRQSLDRIDGWQTQFLSGINQQIIDNFIKIIKDYTSMISEHLSYMIDAGSRLRLANPSYNLMRGYSITRDGFGQIIRKADVLHHGDILQTQLASGKIISEVKDGQA